MPGPDLLKNICAPSLFDIPDINLFWLFHLHSFFVRGLLNLVKLEANKLHASLRNSGCKSGLRVFLVPGKRKRLFADAALALTYLFWACLQMANTKRTTKTVRD